MVNMNIKSESGSNPENYPSAEATVKQHHPPKTPPLEYSSPLTTTDEKSKEGQGSKADGGSLEDKENTYQALIPQQLTTDLGDYQSLTWHTQHKEYCNIPPLLPLEPEVDS